MSKQEVNKKEEIKQCDIHVVSHSIWLIEQIWLDSMENQIDSAVGYSPFGYVESEIKAKDFCTKGKTFTSKDCWAVYDEQPQYKYKEVKYCG